MLFRFSEKFGESLPRAMELSPNRIAGLSSQFRNLIVTQLLICHEQQQQAVLRRKPIQRFLNALPKLGRFQAAQRRI